MGIIHTYLSIQTTRFWGPDFLDEDGDQNDARNASP